MRRLRFRPEFLLAVCFAAGWSLNPGGAAALADGNQVLGAERRSAPGETRGPRSGWQSRGRTAEAAPANKASSEPRFAGSPGPADTDAPPLVPITQLASWPSNHTGPWNQTGAPHSTGPPHSTRSSTAQRSKAVVSPPPATRRADGVGPMTASRGGEPPRVLWASAPAGTTRVLSPADIPPALSPSGTVSQQPFTQQPFVQQSFAQQSPDGISPTCGAFAGTPPARFGPAWTTSSPRVIYRASAAPAAVTQPAQATVPMTMNPPARRVRPVYMGRGILGQPKLYVQGQPVRNALRFLTP